MAVIQLFNEIGTIFRNTPTFAIVLEIFLLITVIWLLLHKRGGGRRRRFTKEEEDSIIENYEPEPLVGETDPNHPLLRTRMVTSKVGKRINVDGHDCLNLGSHNYLGFLEDQDILEEACKSLRKYGVGSCGPRGFYGTMDVHLELEERIAKYMDLEEAIVYSYGFSTVASAIPAYAKRGDIIFVDEAVNFAIQKGLDASRSMIVYFKHNDVKDLERMLVEQEKRDQKNPKKALKTRRFLVAEGIYMNTGEICPLPELVALRKQYKLRIFVDESISFGTLGKGGRGVTEHFNIDRNEIDLISAGMEGSMATIGGFCVGSHFIAEHQRLSGLGYIFSASLPPMLTQAAISALDRFEREPQIFKQLQTNARLLHKIFSHFSKLRLCGDELSPVKHLYLALPLENNEAEQKLLTEVADKCIARGVAVVEAAYLQDREHKPVRPSIRIAVNRLLEESEIAAAFDIIESVSSAVL
ncbi:serine palmitoyltransferase 1 [Drosophila guanche]|uniref:Serine palmitoyltransferase 1 n=1 Tax=Drosophila guanche TaxID=7266 RepID=A0A3B0JQH2_DROGU|nr:serine palmitoyltransferase 1 [Drosophila guanche]XP_034135470.1 serine palmitoyltransferase 1 [Drosophila guanche]XP_034135477.1 serine palmitoyltransferase 1 [Drosophila guanche]SPP73408.1 blast:Serine palmitoyltransferase 1 [Drosophila guanche]